MELPEINEIKQIRKKMGLSLREFAKKCNLSVSWINQVETGVISDPSYLKIKKYLTYMKMKNTLNNKLQKNYVFLVKNLGNRQIQNLKNI